jgi:hypothetical protein
VQDGEVLHFLFLWDGGWEDGKMRRNVKPSFTFFSDLPGLPGEGVN